ncbi:helix-turn-helix domain-containing protein [Aerococcaceae bacterium NML191219]|nr:helix-turn-helix domain-containing protein [Aerococcaceae bacterium NML191219]
MLLQKILALYPETLIDVMPASPENYRQFALQSHTLYIPCSALDSNAIALLELLTDTPTLAHVLTGDDHAWQQFLLHQQPITTSHNKIRFLHIQFPVEQTDFDRRLWSETLTSASQNIIASLPIDTNRQLLVVNGQITAETLIMELNGLLNTLNADFDLLACAYLGQLYKVDATLPTRLEQELAILATFPESEATSTIIPISTALLHAIGRNASQSYPLLTQLKQVITHSAEYNATIQALVEHQGNLTHAADKLFIHRNTLTYRINKFAKETGLNLQYLPDLMLCYLVL